MIRTTLEQKWSGTRQIHYRLLLDKEDIGEVWLCREDEFAEDCHIASVEVVENLRGQGYGKEIMIHILNIARRMGYKKACLRVRAENTPAVKLYEKFGFKTYASYTPERDKRPILRMETYL